MRCFIWVLKSTPSTYVIYKDGFIVCFTANHIFEQSTEPLTMLYYNAALARISVCTSHSEAMLLCVLVYFGLLVSDGILLIFCRHSNVLGNSCHVWRQMLHWSRTGRSPLKDTRQDVWTNYSASGAN
jgi:hypothetical protein